jgi:leader peptidase (prepilin peptidase)/N-methyltransferase
LIDSGIGAAAGFSILALLREGYRQLRGHDGLGLGDAKLLGAVGAWLGWHALSSVVLLAALGGLGIAVIVRLSGRSITPDQKLPFGPFLAAGAWVVWLHGGLTLEW